MTGKRVVRRRIAVWGSLVLLLGAGLTGCTSSPGPSDATSAAPANQQALEFEADLGTMYANVPVLFNPAELSGGAAVDAHERLEFDTQQDVPKGLEVATPGAAELPRLCEEGEPCRDGEEPRFAPEEAVVARADEGYDGAPFTLTGQAVDADGQATDFSMVITPEFVEKAPGNTASPLTKPFTSSAGDSKLTLDFSEAMMVTHAGGNSFVTGTYSAKFSATVRPTGSALTSSHEGDYVADELDINKLEDNETKIAGERGVLAIRIDGTKGQVEFKVGDDLTVQVPYAKLLGSLYSSSPMSS